MNSPHDIIKAAQKEKRTALLEHEAKELARVVGVPVPEFRFVKTNDQQALIAAARELGYPLALKAISPDIIHKTDAAAVLLDIVDTSRLEAAVDDITNGVAEKMPGATIQGFLLERMMPPGLELLIGGIRDEQFGPSIAFGLGGIWVEALKDAAFGILPLTRQEVLDLMAETRAGILLKGIRGAPALDQESVLAAIDAVSSLMLNHEEIQEIDINPLRVYEHGAVALDVRIILT